MAGDARSSAGSVDLKWCGSNLPTGSPGAAPPTSLQKRCKFRGVAKGHGKRFGSPVRMKYTLPLGTGGEDPRGVRMNAPLISVVPQTIAGDARLRVLKQLERKLLWLSSWM